MLPPPSLLLLQNPIHPSSFHSPNHHSPTVTSPPLSAISVRHTQYPFLYQSSPTLLTRRASTTVVEQHIDPFSFTPKALANPPPTPPHHLYAAQQSTPPTPTIAQDPPTTASNNNSSNNGTTPTSTHQVPYSAPAQQSHFPGEAAGWGGGGASSTTSRTPRAALPASFGTAASTFAMGGHSYDRRVSEPTLHLHHHGHHPAEGPASGSTSTSGGGSPTYRRESISIQPPPLLPVLFPQPQQQTPLHEIPPSPGRVHHTHSAHSTVSVSSAGGYQLGHQRRGSGQTHTSEESGSLSPTSPNPGSALPTSPGSGKQYSFISLAHPHVRKRPRRRYDEIERLYACNFPGCTKSYGTLNHLNAHVTMQRHGPKRTPQEFKEMRKQWRRSKQREGSGGAGPAILPAPTSPTASLLSLTSSSMPTYQDTQQRTRGGTGLTVAIPDSSPPMQPFPGNASAQELRYGSAYDPPMPSWMTAVTTTPASAATSQAFSFSAQPRSDFDFDHEISPIDPGRGPHPASMGGGRPSSSSGAAEMHSASVSPVQWRAPGGIEGRRHSSVSLSPVDDRERYHTTTALSHYPITLQANAPSAPSQYAPPPLLPLFEGQGQGRLPPGSTLLTPLHPPAPDGEGEGGNGSRS